MTRLTYETIVPLAEPGPFEATRPKMPRRPIRFGRRGVLKGAFAGGVGIAMTMFEQAPIVQKAAAACTTTLETTIRADCPEDIAGTCSPACGPSTVYLDVCDANGWHKTSGNYRMRPNQCTSSPYDGWMWYASPCGCPVGFGRHYRCHDGCKLISGSWVNSICRTTTPCFG